MTHPGPGRPIPTYPSPALSVETVGGPQWTLADRRPARFTMIVFYRGLHCPVCHAYLAELERLLPEYAARGVEMIAISGDDAERAARTRSEWKLETLPVGFGQDTESMRAWGLYVSAGIKEPEPAEFGEPGLFLIRPDGTVYYVGINSMPFGRPALGEMLKSIDFIIARGYPPRGER
jgi:peroxiredoxin